MRFRSYVEVLRERAEARPEAPLFRWLADGEEPAEGLTRGGLEARARGIAAALGERLRPGEPAVLLYPPGLELVAAFFGCLAAGVAAVPAYPPRGARSLPRLRSILEDARPRAVLTESGMLGRLRKLAAGEPALAGVPLIATDGVAPEAGKGRPAPEPGLDDLAFIQYTSGSTAEPKGVMVSHGNLLHNEEAIRRAFGQSEESVVVSWLPLYHDMGLIGGVLQPVYSGGRCVLMAPAAFLRRPVRWLRAIHEHGATTSGGPDFAYALCAREVGEEERAGLDLSRWEVAFDGSEPVRPATLERFARAFAPCGFRRSAFQPCYGLAEATLFVTGGEVGEAPVVRSLDAAGLERHRAAPADGEGARAVAGCGRTADGHRVTIAEPETGRPLPAGRVGEVWVAGPSVARGYWGRPDASAEVFGARLAGAAEDGPSWLRTGDLGFLDGGELFVTGRLKDLVILRGRNHYPHDLERTAELAHPAVAAGASAAFAVEAGEEERLVLACEVGRREAAAPAEALAEVAGAVREAVFREHEARVHDLVLLPPGSVPRTSSGKVRRAACRAAYLAGELEGRRLRPAPREVPPTSLRPEEAASHEVPPTSWSSPEVPPSSLPSPEVPPSSLQGLSPDERRVRVEEALRGRAAELLGVAPAEIDPERPLVALGLDSLGAAGLAHGVERSLSVPVGSSEMAALLDGSSLRDLADAVLARLAEEGGAPPAAGIPALADPPDELPLSYGQRSLWFLHDLGQQPRAYVIAVALRVSGPLDTPALRRAAEALVRRHPALRTTFREEDGEPRQRVQAELPPEWTETDARELPGDALAAALREAAWRPFDLAAGPLLRLALFRRAEDHLLVVAVHHIVADFWSMGVLHRELDALYGQETGGPAAALDPSVLHPADHVRWQAERLAGPEGERLWAYWRRALAGPPPDLDLPTDRPRPPVQGERGAAVGLWLEPARAEALRRQARDSGATLFTVLLAGFQALLQRWTGQDDLVVGTPAAGRGAAELASLVGYLVNPLPLRGDLSCDPAGEELLRRLRRTVLGAFEHQELPFALLTERLRPVRDPGRAPLFQAMLTLQAPRRPEEAPLAALALPGSGVRSGARAALGPLALEPVPLGDPPSQYDLHLVAAAVAGGLALSLVHDADLFDRTTGRRMLGGLATLLDALAAEPERPLSELPLLAPAERHQLLAEWNDTAVAVAEAPSGIKATATLHEAVAARAAAGPDRIAVEHGGRAMSYGELQRRARRLAGRLRGLGAGPETPVAVLLERSERTVEALLGVLEAGAAYLPLDPAYPPARIAAALADSGAPVAVTTADLAGLLEGWGGRRLELDRPAPEMKETAGEPETEPPALHGLATAYLIYTSGSTGRPKGVQVSHRAILNFLGSMARRPGIGPDDGLLAVTTPAFDIAALELFLPLLAGARVVVAGRVEAADGEALRDALRDRRATVMQGTPATWRLLLDSGGAAGWPAPGVPPFRVLCGGEALPPGLAAELAARAASAWNLYGPTETTVWSTVDRLASGGAVTLGRPIAETSVHVLDARLRPVPVGAAGEIAIGGRGHARGYLRRPAATAERFVPDPAGPSGGRLYRTGDLVRRRPDGRLDYLGRLDHQVKLRGHRIELGEVEAALARHPGVARAVAVVREVGPEDRRLVAYAVPAPGARPAPEELRAHLRAELPETFVPGAFVLLDELPLTPNGKVDRKALPAPEALAAGDGGAIVPPRSALERAVARVWCRVLGVESVGVHDSFFDLGGHSLLLARVRRELEAEIGRSPRMVDLFRYPTVAALAAWAETEAVGPAGEASGDSDRAVAPAAPRPASGGPLARRAVAVIGMAGRFPGAGSVDELWRRLRAGAECITRFSKEELAAAGVAPELLDDPRYVPAAGFLDGADLFDAGFFGVTAREAELMDPQHRLFLECAWEALEDAGHAPERVPGRVGVFAGVGMNTYLLQAGLGAELGTAARYQAFVGNDKDFVPTRVSYKLDLRGPSVNVQTACSSSLVAVHLARRSLLDGECDTALAGGVTVRVPLREGYLHEEGGIPSPDGHCRPFDAAAAGTVFGSGVGIVVLKPLERALADGDAIRAVIRGSAVNNDGAGKIGYTAPSVSGQAAVVREALAAAGVEPATVTYVEAHGTGTALGDPVEVAALTEAFGPGLPPGSCALGSVKGNLGHLDTAAGVAGLIKAVKALEEGEIPGTLHFREPSPELGLDAGPFHVPAGRAPWRRNGTPRRAGVSSFGIGGTNVHAVLEEAPEREEHRPSRPGKLLLLSARSAQALEAATDRLAERLREAAGAGGAARADLADVAFTLQTGRRRFAHRRALVAADPEDALAALGASSPLDRERLQDRVDEARERPVAFLFPGQGAQHPGMARGLYESEPAFRRELDACARHLEPRLGLDLRQALFAEGEEAARALRRTELAQPALFAVEHALARLWMSWGVAPSAMLGHSVGEYVAACLAGVFSLPDALDLVAVRGRLMQAMPRGAMLAVDAPEKEAAGLLGPELALAAVNGPGASVVAGPEGAVRALEERLAREGVRARRLHTSHAFHSPLMAGAVEGLVAEVRRIGPRPPERPFVSNLTGTWITAAQATDPAYWGRQLRGTVRFGDGLARLLEDPAAALLEVGPGRSLAGLVRRAAPERVVVSSLPHPREPEDDGAFLLRSLGRLWLAGAEIDWAGFAAHERRRRVPLPTYPFERRRFWLEARPAVAVTAPEPAREPADWLSAPSWRSAPLGSAPLPGSPPGSSGGSWLIVDGGGGLGRALARELKARIGGRPGSPPDDATAGVARVAPAEAEERLAALARAGAWDEWPDRVVHALALGPEAADPEAEVERAYHGLARLLRVLGAAERPVRLDVLSQGLHRVAGDGPPIPLRSLLLGPVLSAPLEYPRLVCRSVDLPAAVGPDDRDGVLEDLVAELLAGPAGPGDDPVVALRGGRRWTRAFEPVRGAEGGDGSPRLREGGHYLVTGGLGGVGLALAGDLARRARARLTLVGRSARPPRARWAELAAGTGEAAERARRLLALEEAGGEVLALAADVTDPAAMARALAAAEDRFGPVHGVVHAAGVAGGTLLQLETPDAARAVLRPKVEGTRVLRTLLASREPDFVVLVSSVTAVAGGLGQAAYTAANAYLDAVAEAAFRRRGPAVLAIGWGRWDGVGMAARGVDPVGGAAAPTGHPLLGDAVLESPGRSVFRAELAPESHWTLTEHRVAGRPTVPGAAWLEAVRAAAARRWPEADVELRDVVFPEPLAVPDGSSAEVLTVLDAEAGGKGGARFRVVTRGEGGAWREHARGRVAPAAGGQAAALDLDELRAACAARVLEAETGEGEADPTGGLLATGPRWRSLRRLRVGEDRLLAELELDRRFGADLEAHALHPALLDLAAGAVRLAAGGSYLPLAYGRVTVRRPLTARCFARAVLPGPLAGAPETLRCDVSVLDEEGRLLVEVEGFVMRRVDPAAAARMAAAAPGAPARPLLAELEGGLAGTLIPPEAGAESFHSALAAPRAPHLLVTPDPPEAAIRALRSLDRDRLAERLAALSGPALELRRDTGARTAAGAAGSTLLGGGELERRIAAVWQRVLGVERVGLHDNFFELGGTSLSGIQLVSELGRELAPALGPEAAERLSPVALFEAPTVASLARSLRPAGEGAASTTERARSRAEQKARALGEAAARAPRRAPDRRVAAG